MTEKRSCNEILKGFNKSKFSFTKGDITFYEYLKNKKNIKQECVDTKDIKGSLLFLFRLIKEVGILKFSWLFIQIAAVVKIIFFM